MANSPLVSIRIPPETLDRIDQLAERLYPSRRMGKKPNRSQVILDAIEQFLAQAELDGLAVSADSSISSHPYSLAQNASSNSIPAIQTDAADPLIKNQTVFNESPEPLGDDLNLTYSLDSGRSIDATANNEVAAQLEPEDFSTRKYIDWWLDYLSYMRKFTKTWF